MVCSLDNLICDTYYQAWSEEGDSPMEFELWTICQGAGNKHFINDKWGLGVSGSAVVMQQLKLPLVGTEMRRQRRKRSGSCSVYLLSYWRSMGKIAITEVVGFDDGWVGETQ